MPKSVEDQLEFFLDEKGESVIISGIEARAIIVDIRDKINYYDDKMIRTDIAIFTGDIIEYQGAKWIIVSEIDKNKKSYKARMRKVNYNIKIVVNEELAEFKSIIEGISFGIDDGKFMSFEAGKIQVIIPSDFVSNIIEVAMRFIKMDKAWKIVGIDKSRTGLIILHCEKDLFLTYDDRENEIADTDKIAVWEIYINEENQQIAVDSDFTYTATIYKNGSEVQDAILVWESSDTNVAIVNNGLVAGVTIGNAIISVHIQDKPTINTSLQLEIIESVPDVITYKMWCSYTDGSGKSYTDFSVLYGYEKWYGTEKYINGALADHNDTYTFSLNPNGTPSNKYEYTVIDDYKVKIKANGYGNTVKLTATSNESGESVTQDIQLKSLF